MADELTPEEVEARDAALARHLYLFSGREAVWIGAWSAARAYYLEQPEDQRTAPVMPDPGNLALRRARGDRAGVQSPEDPAIPRLALHHESGRDPEVVDISEHRARGAKR